MDCVEQAAALFKEGYSCSQAVLAAFAPDWGVDRETALRVSTAFGGGMGRMGETCGAVAGAMMVIGLRHGRLQAEDTATKETAYGCVADFVEQFRARNGATTCRALLGHDIGTPEGRALIKELDLSGTLCPRFVRDAAEIVAQLVAE